MPTISGTVYDDTGAPAASRTVRAYRRDTGALLGVATSSDGTAAPGTGDPFFDDVTLLVPADTAAPNDLGPDRQVLLYGPPNSQKADIVSNTSASGGSCIRTAYSASNVGFSNASGAVSFGTGDFTIEFSVDFSSLNSSMSGAYTSHYFLDAGDWWLKAGNSQVFFEVSNLGGSAQLGFRPITENYWPELIHIAIVRVSGVLSIFTNGRLAASASWPYAMYGPSHPHYAYIGGAGLDSPAYSVYRFTVGYYFDNIRVTKLARYSSTFAVPTSAPPTDVSDSAWAKVVTLLTGGGPDASLYAVTWTPIGSMTNTSAVSKFGGSSMQFSGGRAATAANLPAFVVDTYGRFAIDFWVNRDDLADATLLEFQWGNLSSVGQKYLVSLRVLSHTSGKLKLELYRDNYTNLGDYVDTTTVGTSTTSAVSSGVWHYISIRMNGHIWRLWVDGVYVGEFSGSWVSYTPSLGVTLGSRLDGSSAFNGYIDEFRITNGASRDSLFTPPTELVSYALVDGTGSDADFANVSLLVHADGTDGSTTVTDSSESAKTLTCVGTAAISTTQSKFGGSSLYFDGTSEVQMPAAADLTLTADFTVEFWVRRAATGGDMGTFGDLSSGNDQVQVNASNIFMYNSSGQSYTATLAVTMNNVWTNIAISRNGSTLRVFQDGVLLSGTGTFTATLDLSNGSIGKLRGYPSWFVGYLDEIRITKGVGRYTAGFTPATAQFGGAPPTDVIGKYTIDTSYVGECQVLCLDDATGTYYNDLVHRTTTT